ncbi:MAG: hypothetical protein K6357_01850 [Elusimicrobiota bacterium]
MKKIAFLFLIFLLSCAGIERNYSENDLYDLKYPDYSYMESAHFIVNADVSVDIRRISDEAEKFYYTIMMDTNLFSFVPEKPYRIIVHKDRETFLNKTASRKWIDGFINDKRIEVYFSSNVYCVLAHEITHLVLSEFLEDASQFYPWISEGLATYEERKACSEIDFIYNDIFVNIVKESPYSATSLSLYKPSTNDLEKDIKKFYVQSSDIVKFMIEKEGNFKFYIFLDGLRKGMPVDEALKNAYPLSFHSLKALWDRWYEERVIR